jgi:hypothetical protein
LAKGSPTSSEGGVFLGARWLGVAVAVGVTVAVGVVVAEPDAGSDEGGDEVVTAVATAGSTGGGAGVRPASSAHAVTTDTSSAPIPMIHAHGIARMGGRTLSMATRISARLGGSSSSAIR